MAFEELPADYDTFFKTGELSDALKAQMTPPVDTTVAPTPPVETVVEAKPVVADPPPVTTPAPDQSNVYLQQLLRDREEAGKLMGEQMKQLQAKIDQMSAPPAPDPATDPLGAMMHQMKQMEKQIADFQKGATETQAQATQQQQAQQLLNHVKQQIGEFSKTHADYQQAYEHLKSVRTADYTEMGLTQAQIIQQLGNDERTIVQQALQQGKNPAELVYSFAKRYGYVPPVATPTPEEKLETIKKGLEASKQVTQAAPPATGYTLDAAKVASDRDLTNMVENHWEEMMGGRKGIF